MNLKKPNLSELDKLKRHVEQNEQQTHIVIAAAWLVLTVISVTQHASSAVLTDWLWITRMALFASILLLKTGVWGWKALRWYKNTKDETNKVESIVPHVTITVTIATLVLSNSAFGLFDTLRDKEKHHKTIDQVRINNIAVNIVFVTLNACALFMAFYKLKKSVTVERTGFMSFSIEFAKDKIKRSPMMELLDAMTTL